MVVLIGITLKISRYAFPLVSLHTYLKEVLVLTVFVHLKYSITVSTIGNALGKGNLYHITFCLY